MGEHIFLTVESDANHENVMPHTDFDLPGLARYLHLTPPQVAKLADRGQLPGRKVAGQWRFAKDDIHHWLERRIGLSDEEGLVAVEGVLHRADQGAEQPEILIAELLPPEAIAIPLAARTRTSVVDSMVALAAQTGWLWDPQAMAEAVRSREEMHTTALENGVALLHPRRPLPKILAQAFLALGAPPAGSPSGPAPPDRPLLPHLLDRRAGAPSRPGPLEPHPGRPRRGRRPARRPRRPSRPAADHPQRGAIGLMPTRDRRGRTSPPPPPPLAPSRTLPGPPAGCRAPPAISCHVFRRTLTIL